MQILIVNLLFNQELEIIKLLLVHSNIIQFMTVNLEQIIEMEIQMIIQAIILFLEI